jgi:kynurenine 3-monooxygenase
VRHIRVQNTVNKLSSYHSSAGNVVILGDAAHSSGGASGQGCNAALQDAQVLDQLLSEVDDDISKVLPLYSERRVPEGHALLDLSINQGPKAPALRVIFLLASFLETLGHSLLPSVVNPPVQNLLTQTDWSFTKIYNVRSHTPPITHTHTHTHAYTHM